MTTKTPSHMDSALPVEARVDALMAEMTLEEKIAQLGSYWVYEMLDGSTYSPEKAERLLHNGIGQITRVGGSSNLRPAQVAALANQIQKYLIENTRLGIPAVIHEECCSGYMTRGATVFPQAIGVASTWDPELTQAMGDVIRQQMRAVGAHHALAPVLDVARDARWGRTEETFGEDPYLTARLGVAYIKGIQGDDLKHGIAATGKHFVGYSVTEGGMNWAPAHLGWRELREVYLYPFEAAIREAKMASIMNAYHEIDGIPCGSSKELLTDLLREEWGFDGTVVSDYFAVNMLLEYHHVAPTKSAAAKQALAAGIDVELPSTDCFGDPLLAAVKNGDVPMELIDRALRRVLAQKFVLGVFDQPYVDVEAVNFDTPEQRQFAREIAHKTMVLLKNEDDFLPLSKQLDSIAVIGPSADSVRNLFGDYAYPAHMEMLIEATAQNNMFNQPLPEGLNAQSADDFIPAISVLAAIKAQVSPDTKVIYARGCDVTDPSTDGFAAAVDAAKQAKVAVVVVGDKAGLVGYLHQRRSPRPCRLDAPRRPSRPRQSDLRDRHAGRAGTDQRASGQPRMDRRERPRDCRGVVPQRRRRQRPRRRAVRRRESRRQAADQLPANSRADPGLLWASPIRWALTLEGKLRRNQRQAALSVRLRLKLYQVRIQQFADRCGDRPSR